MKLPMHCKDMMSTNKIHFYEQPSEQY